MPHRRPRHLTPRPAGAAAVFDARFITGLADGAAVATWADLTANARNATQATGANQPLYKTAIKGGCPVVRFDGTNDVLTTAAFTLNQPSTMFVVYVVNDNNNRTAIDALAANTRRIFSFPSGGAQFSFVTMFAGTLQTNTAIARGNWVVVRATFNGASSRLSVNGIATTVSPGSSAASGITIGDQGGAGAPLLGDIMSVSGVPGAMSEPLAKRFEQNYARVAKIPCS